MKVNFVLLQKGFMNVVYLKEHLSERLAISTLYHFAIFSFWNVRSLEAAIRGSGCEHLFDSSV
jgi:hypothetical protein